jgi:hypothetical protein
VLARKCHTKCNYKIGQICEVIFYQDDENNCCIAIVRVHSKTQIYFLFSFCLAKKKQKPKAKDQLQFFIAQKASAAPPKN